MIGFDDAPFSREPGTPVSVAGVVCSGTRFEGMLWGQATRDGLDATSVIAGMLGPSKFANQVKLVLTDGLTIGGLNPIDLASLSETLALPCVAVMRRSPDLTAFRRALGKLVDGQERWEIVQRAGPVHELGGFVFQVVGADPIVVAPQLRALTDRGKVPEPLRLAHLIGSAVMTGQSGKRA